MTIEVRARIIAHGHAGRNFEGQETVVFLPELDDPRIADLRAENAELRLTNVQLSRQVDELRPRPRRRSWWARLWGRR